MYHVQNRSGGNLCLLTLYVSNEYDCDWFYGGYPGNPQVGPLSLRTSVKVVYVINPVYTCKSGLLYTRLESALALSTRTQRSRVGSSTYNELAGYKSGLPHDLEVVCNWKMIRRHKMIRRERWRKRETRRRLRALTSKPSYV